MNTRTTDTYREHLRQAEIAAGWLVRLEMEGAGCHAAFAAWLKEAPLHVREFLAISGLSKRLEKIDPHRQIDVDELIAAAGANVVPLSDNEPRPAAVSAPSAPLTMGQNRGKWRWAAIAASVAILAVAWQWVGPLIVGATYSTSLGEQRTVKLSDGSILVLNTRSRAEVRFLRDRRDIRLLEGEALFFVAQDAARPFRVATGDTVIQAIGTQFNVRRNANATIVSVMEGRVRVSTKQDVGGPLAAGEKANVARDGRIKKQALADAAEATAWRQRRLIFRDDSLATVAAEFNRYNEFQVRVEGEAVSKKLLTGSFNADNPQGLIRFLEKDDALAIENNGESVVIRGR